ncbi:MAG: hypothetical protein ACTSVY_15930 [Candidatus Helarchaeota archaeon]
MSEKNLEKEMKKALASYEKAQKMIANEKFDKALKEFKKAFDKFMKIGSLKQAEKVALRLVESSLIEKRYNIASNALIDAANIALLEDRMSSAYQHYKSAMNFLVEDPKINKQKLSAEIACFASLIQVLKGNFQEAIDFFKKQMEINKFKGISEIQIISFSESFFNTLISKNKEYYDKTKSKWKKLELREGEKKVIKNCMALLEIYLNTKLIYTIDKEKLSAGEGLELKVTPNSITDIELIDISTRYDTQRLELTEEPKILDQEVIFHFKTRLSGNGFIGPITFQVQTKDGYRFPLIFKKEIIIEPGKGNVIVNAPEVFEIVQAEKAELEFILKNEGKGEVIDISLKLEIPEEILLIGGSIIKKIHALPTNADFALTFLVQALLQGKFKSKYYLSYNDGYETRNEEKEFMILVR